MQNILRAYEIFKSDNKEKNKEIYQGLSHNSRITWEFIVQHPHFDWDWSTISQHSCVTWEIIVNNPTLPWDWSAISLNPNLTWEIISTNLDRQWWWSPLSQHPCVTWEIIQENTHLEWDPWYACYNPNFTLQIIEDNREWFGQCLYLAIENCYDRLDNGETSLEFISKMMDTLVTLGHSLSHSVYRSLVILGHTPLTPSLSIDAKISSWDMYKLSTQIPLEFIQNHPELKWEFGGVSRNPNLTWEFVMANLDKRWDWKALSRSPIVTMEIIDSSPNIPWNWGEVSSNPNLTWDYVINNRDRPWSLYSLFECRGRTNDNRYFHLDRYRKNVLKRFWDESWYEFNEIAYHPDRVCDWCLDEEKKKELRANFKL